MGTHCDAIAEALFEVLDNTKEPELKALIAAVKSLRDTNPIQYKHIKRRPFGWAILKTIEEVEEMYS